MFEEGQERHFRATQAMSLVPPATEVRVATGDGAPCHHLRCFGAATIPATSVFIDARLSL